MARRNAMYLTPRLAGVTPRIIGQCFVTLTSTSPRGGRSMYSASARKAPSDSSVPCVNVQFAHLWQMVCVTGDPGWAFTTVRWHQAQTTTAEVCAAMSMLRLKQLGASTTCQGKRGTRINLRIGRTDWSL